MAALGTICYAILAPILADSGTQVESGPTWLVGGGLGLAGASAAWAIRQGAVWMREGVKIAYQQLGVPIGVAHLELLQSLKKSREEDSKSLASLAAEVHHLSQSIRCRHNEP